jgi:hypothetical protein
MRCDVSNNQGTCKKTVTNKYCKKTPWMLYKESSHLKNIMKRQQKINEKNQQNKLRLTFTFKLKAKEISLYTME